MSSYLIQVDRCNICPFTIGITVQTRHHPFEFRLRTNQQRRCRLRPPGHLRRAYACHLVSQVDRPGSTTLRFASGPAKRYQQDSNAPQRRKAYLLHTRYTPSHALYRYLDVPKSSLVSAIRLVLVLVLTQRLRGWPRAPERTRGERGNVRLPGHILVRFSSSFGPTTILRYLKEAKHSTSTEYAAGPFCHERVTHHVSVLLMSNPLQDPRWSKCGGSITHD